MGTYNSAVITNGGQSMIAQAVAGASLEFTTIKTSSYAYPAGTNLATLTTINGIKQSKDITGAAVYNSRVIKISAAVDNTGISIAYTINTIGIYAKVGSSAESLFAVVTASAADTMPAYDSKPYSYIYEISLTMQNAANVTVTVNAAGLVNVADLNAAKVEIQGEIADLKSDLEVIADITLSIVSGTFVNKNNGNIGTSSGYVTNDYLPIMGDVWLYSYAGDDNAGYAFYDEAKNPLSHGDIYSIRRTWTKLTAPQGAKYFRATCGVNQASELAIKIAVSDSVEKLISDDMSNTLRGITYDAGYITNNAGTIGELTPSDGYYSKIMLVAPGEKYLISGSGASSARLWSTHRADRSTVRVADSDVSAQKHPVVLTIQSGEKYLVFNTSSATSVYGVEAWDNARSTFNTRDFIYNIEKTAIALDSTLTQDGKAADAQAVGKKFKDLSYTFRNNLSTDGANKLPDCTIYKIGGSSSPNYYGLSGSSYSFQMPQKKLHIYYEFKQTEAVPNSASSVVSKRLIQAFATGYFIVNYSGSLFLNGELFQRFAIQCVSGANSETLLLNSINYKHMQGEDAFRVKYTNAITANSVCTISFKDTAVDVNVDGTQTQIACTTSTTITDLVTALDAISGLSAEVIIAEDKTYGDLLPVVSKSTSTSTDIDLIYNGTLYDETAYTDALTVYIPLAVNEDWHSVEMIYDPDGKVSAAFDGVTVSVDYGNTTPNTTLILNSQYAPIVMRNLSIDYDSAGDAEVVDNLVDPSLPTVKKQIVSSHNPRLLIYEGHGIDVCTDADAPLTDDMACSTERLHILFTEAKARGYVPVSWEDIIAWKKNGKALPKRCFTMMFDDWRFDNYVDYAEKAIRRF